MRLSFTICVISLVSLVLGIPILAFKPGDVVHMPHSAVTNNHKSTAPNMKYDTTKTKVSWDPKGAHPAVVLAGPHPDGTYDLAHISHNLPKDAYPEQANIFSEYHSGLEGRVNLSPKTVNAHGSQLTAHSAGPMDPAYFQKFQADRAANQPKPKPPPPPPSPPPAPANDNTDATGAKRQRSQSPAMDDTKKQKTEQSSNTTP